MDVLSPPPAAATTKQVIRLLVIDDPEDGLVVEFRGELGDDQAADLIAEVIDHQIRDREPAAMLAFVQLFQGAIARKGAMPGT